jgi:hypothetical protein
MQHVFLSYIELRAQFQLQLVYLLLRSGTSEWATYPIDQSEPLTSLSESAVDISEAPVVSARLVAEAQLASSPFLVRTSEIPI